MNEIMRRGQQARTTQAAEGLPRWRWTTAELLRLAELGAFDGQDDFELIGGEYRAAQLRTTGDAASATVGAPVANA